MTEARWITGDSLAVLATMPDASVDLILTSPPFLALRSYLPADHPDKAAELGSEPDPASHLDALLDHVTEWRRVLAPHGSICVELGDTYAGARGYGTIGTNPAYGDRADRKLTEARVDRNFKRADDGWPQAKSLAMIPELFRVALAYGFNPLNGRRIEPWMVRNVIRWVRPNPPVGALSDKFRPATSEMAVACTAKDRYFDLEAVRGERSANTHAHTAKGVQSNPNSGKSADDDRRGGNFSTLVTIHETAGAPPLDWWPIPTHPYAGAHYATFPPDLCVIPIKAMCPLRVCTTCGAPSRRIVEIERIADADDSQRRQPASVYRLNNHNQAPEFGWEMSHRTVGFTDCGHGTWRSGVVLDPFAGSGTVGAVATGHGRDFIGVDLDGRNVELARERIGPLYMTAEERTA